MLELSPFPGDELEVRMHFDEYSMWFDVCNM